MDLTEVEREGSLSRSEYGLVLGFFWTQWQGSWCDKRLEICWPTEQLLAFGEQIRFMEFVKLKLRNVSNCTFPHLQTGSRK